MSQAIDIALNYFDPNPEQFVFSSPKGKNQIEAVQNAHAKRVQNILLPNRSTIQKYINEQKSKDRGSRIHSLTKEYLEFPRACRQDGGHPA